MKKEVYIGIITLAVGLIVGFYFGRQKVVEKEVVKYVKGETITDTITINLPIKEIRTTDTLYLVERDTVKTLIDYNLYRTYKQTISNEYGNIDFIAGIQYNQLQDLKYSQTPVVKEVTKTVMPVWQPYVGAGYNSFNQASFKGGVFYHKMGLEGSYIYDIDRKKVGFSVGLNYLF